MLKARMKSVKLQLPPLPTIKDIIKLYKLRALKQLSQNFLLDMRLTDKIVRAAGGIRGGEVMEVGPGPGGITRSIIARNPSKVILVEKDPRFLPPLQMLGEASPVPVSVYKGDVLSFNMEQMFSRELKREWSERPPNIHLIGNLPFSVSTRLIILWLQDISERSNAWRYGRVPMTLTFQKEVAERITAPIMSPQRCRLSIMCQNWCYTHHKFNIPGSAFLPPPDVDVGVVHLVPLESPVISLPFKLVEKVTRCIFSFRQKYCYKGVQTLFPRGAHERLVPEMFERAEISPETRPYQLTVPEIGRLCHAYHDIVQRQPSLARYNNRQPNTHPDNVDVTDGCEVSITDGNDNDSDSPDHRGV